MDALHQTVWDWSRPAMVNRIRDGPAILLENFYVPLSDSELNALRSVYLKIEAFYLHINYEHMLDYLQKKLFRYDG